MVFSMPCMSKLGNVDQLDQGIVVMQKKHLTNSALNQNLCLVTNPNSCWYSPAWSLLVLGPEGPMIHIFLSLNLSNPDWPGPFNLQIPDYPGPVGPHYTTLEWTA
jgi:hypothetical protein